MMINSSVNKFTNLFGWLILIFGVCVLPALAHQLSVFAWVDDETVHVQGKLPKGKHPKQGTIFVYDGNDKLLLEKQIQPDGTATFPLKNWETGLKIVLDCSNGAASTIAPDLFSRLDVDIIPLSVSPDGININDDCGSQHPGTLARRVVAENADLGLAFDGDADR